MLDNPEFHFAGEVLQLTSAKSRLPLKLLFRQTEGIQAIISELYQE